MQKCKLIFSPVMARNCLKAGCQIVDIKPLKEDISKSIFIFVDDDLLQKTLLELHIKFNSQG